MSAENEGMSPKVASEYCFLDLCCAGGRKAAGHGFFKGRVDTAPSIELIVRDTFTRARRRLVCDNNGFPSPTRPPERPKEELQKTRLGVRAAAELAALRGDPSQQSLEMAIKACRSRNEREALCAAIFETKAFRWLTDAMAKQILEDDFPKELGLRPAHLSTQMARFHQEVARRMFRPVFAMPTFDLYAYDSSVRLDGQHVATSYASLASVEALSKKQGDVVAALEQWCGYTAYPGSERWRDLPSVWWGRLNGCAVFERFDSVLLTEVLVEALRQPLPCPRTMKLVAYLAQRPFVDDHLAEVLRNNLELCYDRLEEEHHPSLRSGDGAFELVAV